MFTARKRKNKLSIIIIIIKENEVVEKLTRHLCKIDKVESLIVNCNAQTSKRDRKSNKTEQHTASPITDLNFELMKFPLLQCKSEASFNLNNYLRLFIHPIFERLY